jgi:spermidine/putrescine-binding protein
MKKVLTAVFTIFCAMIILATVQTAIAATFENGKIEVYISTHKDLSLENYVLETEVIRFIDESKVSLNIAVQELRSGKIYSGNPIKEAVQRAAARGVKVNLILEKSYLKPDTDNQKTFDEFQAADNIQVKADGNPAIFHDKFIVRDYDEPGAALLT